MSEMNYNGIRAMTVCKILSANDTGETGSHQAGILVPKDLSILSFFPELDKNIKNPRITLRFEDNSGTFWTFHFIYYNNKKFGGTRDEHRLTGMTAYIKQNNLKAGDRIYFHQGDDGKMLISHERQANMVTEHSVEYKVKSVTRLKLGNTWKIISI